MNEVVQAELLKPFHFIRYGEYFLSIGFCFRFAPIIYGDQKEMHNMKGIAELTAMPVA